MSHALTQQERAILVARGTMCFPTIVKFKPAPRKKKAVTDPKSPLGGFMVNTGKLLPEKFSRAALMDHAAIGTTKAANTLQSWHAAGWIEHHEEYGNWVRTAKFGLLSESD